MNITLRPVTPSATGATSRIVKTTCVDPSCRERAATDPARRISSHRTLDGQVVYYRCYCDHVQILLVERRRFERHTHERGHHLVAS